MGALLIVALLWILAHALLARRARPEVLHLVLPQGRPDLWEGLIWEALFLLHDRPRAELMVWREGEGEDALWRLLQRRFPGVRFGRGKPSEGERVFTFREGERLSSFRRRLRQNVGQRWGMPERGNPPPLGEAGGM